MKIAIGGDHTAVDLLPVIVEYLKERGHEITQITAEEEQRPDYPVIAEKAANIIARGQCDAGVLICGTGAGISIAANKVRGIRAVACSDTFTAKMAKEHNDANIICFGARVVGHGLAKSITEAWLDAEFQGGRHAERVGMIEEIERRNYERNGA